MANIPSTHHPWRRAAVAGHAEWKRRHDQAGASRLLPRTLKTETASDTRGDRTDFYMDGERVISHRRDE